MAGYCPNCGTAIEGDAKFCPECGTSLEVQKAPEKKPDAEASVTLTTEPKTEPESKQEPEQKPEQKSQEKTEQKSETKNAKAKGNVSAGAAFAAFLLGANLVPYVLRSFWVMMTLKTLSPFQYVLTEIAGMIVAVGLLVVYAKNFAANSRESKSAVFERSVFLTGLYYAISVIGDFGFDTLATGLQKQSLINTGIILLLIFIACIWTYSVTCGMVGAGEKRITLFKKLFGGLLFFFAYNMTLLLRIVISLLPIRVGVSFIGNCGWILFVILMQSIVVQFAVSMGLHKAKTKEKVSAHTHFLRTIIGGGLAAASAVVLLSTNLTPSAEKLCLEDLKLETARGRALLSAGDLTGAIQVFDTVNSHVNAWRAVAEGYGVGHEAISDGDEIMAALYLMSHPDEITERAATGIIGSDDAAWYPFYLAAYAELENLDERQTAVQKEAAYLCIAYDSVINQLPSAEDVREGSAEIIKTCDNYSEVVEFSKVYRMAREAAMGDINQESAVYCMLDYAEEYPNNLLLQISAIESGVGYLKDNATHYERVAELVDRLNALMEKGNLSEELLARYKGLFGDYMSDMNYLDRAEAYYQASGNSGANMQEINLKMAIKAFMANDTEKCYEYTSKIMEKGGDNPLLWHLHTVCSLKRGEFATAIETAGKLADYVKKGGSGDGYLLADLCLFNCVEYMAMSDDTSWTDFEYNIYSDDMDESLKKLFAANPFLDNYCRTLYLDKMVRDRESAQKYADALVEECPGSAQLWYLRGLAYADGELHEEAAKSLEKSLEIDGRQLNAMFALANSYDALGRYKEAYELTLRVEAEMGRDSEVNHSADVYGLGYHNPRLREALEYKLQEEGE